MKNKRKGPNAKLSRRDFLYVTTATGVVLLFNNCSGGFKSIGALSSASTANSSSTGPIEFPPSQTPPPPPPPVGQTVVKLQMTSPTSQTNVPWTFGQVFKQGEIPSGRFITTDANVSQAIIRNLWPDGSVKYAVLSGYSDFATNTPTTLNIGTTLTAPSTKLISEPTNLNVQVTLSGAVSGTYNLQSALGIDLSNWDRTKAGRVRQIQGPVMSEFHYYIPTSDSELAIWFYLRVYYDGSTEIETVIENGWIGSTAPGERDYSVTLLMNNQTKYSGSLQHYSRTRWSRVDWLGANPNITPQHDVTYLRATKLVPNFGYTNPDSTAFQGLSSDLNPTPFALGNWTLNMGDTGYQPSIGILPQWESLYATTGDPRAYAATISNNRGSGRWPIYYRDENTGRVPLYMSYPQTTFTSGWGTQPPTPTGGTRIWEIPHNPSNGYLAYLIEGRWTQLESLQFSAMMAILESNPATRQSGGVLACINAPLTTRGAAWSWRTMGQAATISPTSFNGTSLLSTDSTVGASFVQSIHDTASWIKSRYIDGTIDGGAHKNSIGWIGQYDSYQGGPATDWWGGSWMVAFQGMAWGHIADLAIENLRNQSDVEAVRNFVYLDTLLTIGDETTWNFRRAGTYDRPYLAAGADPGTPVFLTIPQAFSAYKANSNLPALTANKGDTLKDHDSNSDVVATDTSDVGSGYWALHISVIAQAVDAGISGAAQAYSLVTSASNFDPSSANDTPQFAFVPRT